MYTRRIEIDPENIEHYASLAGVYSDLGDEEKALEILDGFDTMVNDPSRAARTYGYLGMRWLRRDAEFAMKLCRRAHELQPGNWLYLWGLGGAHLLTGQFDEAVAKFTESTKLFGGANSINFFCLAMAHGGRGNKEEAASWYKKAMAQMPADRGSMNAALLGVLDSAHSQASTQLGIKTEEE